MRVGRVGLRTPLLVAELRALGQAALGWGGSVAFEAACVTATMVRVLPLDTAQAAAFDASVGVGLLLTWLVVEPLLCLLLVSCLALCLILVRISLSVSTGGDDDDDS